MQITYWPRKISENLLDYRGRTGIIKQVGFVKDKSMVSFDGDTDFCLVPTADLYFQDHLDGYNQPCFN